MTLASDLIEAGRLLDRHAHPWCVVGGLAVSAYVPARFTRDVDLAVAVSGDEEAEAVARAFVDAGWRLTDVVEQQATGRLANVRLRSPRGGVIDLLFAMSGIEDSVVRSAAPLELLPDCVVPTARPGHLVALKLLSRSTERPRDQQDLIALRAVLDATERTRAADAVRAIRIAGSDRGRDLARDLAHLLGGRAPDT